MHTKHTPGPWQCRPGMGTDSEYLVYDGDGNYLTTRGTVHEANGRLIAAAPELLDACQRALNYAKNVANAEGVTFDDDNDLPAIRAAIAKATGS